ncbi:MAG: zinc ribbon domain-containing protein [Planctomycetes bacterium]|nr:zinc ribbon domain-containing protein [Planctomycetota bacterium]
MPIYEYAVVHPDGSHGEIFEVLQRLGEKPLTKHPQTGEPVERLISAASVPRPPAERIKGDISNKNLERQGFTKYQKTSQGKYEKVLGDGPDLIRKDDHV